MRARHHEKFVPSARVNGSPGRTHPPTHASNSPKGRSGVDAPRWLLWYGHRNIALFDVVLSHHPPASSNTTRAPPSASRCAAMPPPAPDPTMQTSYSACWDFSIYRLLWLQASGIWLLASASSPLQHSKDIRVVVRPQSRLRHVPSA